MKHVNLKWLFASIAIGLFGISSVSQADITVLGYWRGGENDPPGAPLNSQYSYANSTTKDSVGSNDLSLVNPLTGDGIGGPYYSNVGLVSNSTSSYFFAASQANPFTTSVFNTATNNWGIQAYTNVATQGFIISNGGYEVGSSNGYSIFVDVFGNYSGIVNGLAEVSGSIAADGTTRNVAFVNDNGTAKLFVDGVINASAVIGDSFTPAGRFTIGGISNLNTPSTFSSFVSGSIDEARIFTFTGAFNTADLNNYVTAVPEPSSFALVSLLGMAGAAYRKRKTQKA